MRMTLAMITLAVIALLSMSTYSDASNRELSEVIALKPEAVLVPLHQTEAHNTYFSDGSLSIGVITNPTDTQQLSVTKFNGNTGTLLSITFKTTVDHVATGFICYENIDANGQPITALWDANNPALSFDVIVDDDGTPTSMIERHFTDAVNVPALPSHDGVLDFAGASGSCDFNTQTLSLLSNPPSFTTDDSDILADFQGKGNATFEVLISSNLDQSPEIAGGSQFGWENGTVIVTYNYT